MPSSPLWSPKLLVLLLAVIVTVGATWLTLRLPETPPEPLRWPTIFLDRLVEAVAGDGTHRRYWAAVLVYSTVVSALHFGGLHLDVYQAIEQWDTITHVTSGAGVAMLLYLTFHLEAPGRRLRWIVPTVLAFGAGFEIYEYLLKDFWHHWTLEYYLRDTVLDLANNVLGGLLVVLVFRLRWDRPGRSTRR